jgi:hypothetical protein
MKDLKWGAALVVVVATALLIDAMYEPISRQGSAVADQVAARSDPIAARVPILVVGDSHQVETGKHLERRLGDRVRVFARRGRPSAEGVRVLRKRMRERYGVVVFDLGSNDYKVGPDGLVRSMRRARRLITPRRCMVIATLPPERRVRLDGVIRRFAERRSVVLFDWQRVVKRRPGLLSEDGLHATPYGYRVRARKLIRVIRSCPRPKLP